MKNSTYLLSNQTFLDLIGSSKIFDGLYAYLFFPTSFIGFILNLVNFFILRRIKEKTTCLYKYLKVYVINSCLINLIFSSMTLFNCIRYFPLAFSYEARIISIFLFGYVCNTLYFFGNTLDILIAIERLAIFKKQLKRLTKHNSPYLICFCILIICIFINIPPFLSVYNKSVHEIQSDFLNKAYINRIKIIGNTSFSNAKCGRIILFISLFTRDLLFLLIEIIILMLTTYYYLQEFNRFKSRLNTLQQIRRRNKARKNLLAMVIYLSITTIISRLITFNAFRKLLLKRNISLTEQFVTMYSVVLKHFLNSFIFYKFNRKFKDVVLDVTKNRSIIGKSQQNVI